MLFIVLSLKAWHPGLKIMWFGHVKHSTGWIVEVRKTNCSCTEVIPHGLKCWWMTERSLEWILLTLRIVLSGEDNLEEDLSTKTNPR